MHVEAFVVNRDSEARSAPDGSSGEQGEQRDGEGETLVCEFDRTVLSLKAEQAGE